MKQIPIKNSDLTASAIGYGCMRIGGSWDENPVSSEQYSTADKALNTAIEQGITLFDHADIYCRGKAETVFGKWLSENPGMRESMVLQTKCGIRPTWDGNGQYVGRYDFSYEHIISSVERSLKRLQTDRLEILLLHRHDVLMEGEEVARAFEELKRSGKVRFFGVSNHNAASMQLLQSYLPFKLVANQLEFNLIHNTLIDQAVTSNISPNFENQRSEGTLEYCTMNAVTVQAWSPIAKGALKPEGENSELFNAVQEIAHEYSTTPEAIMVAWILRHPSKIQPIVGSITPERIVAAAKGAAIDLTREQWYKLFTAARRKPLP